MPQNSYASADSPLLQGRVPHLPVLNADGSIDFRWIYLGDKAFTEPFYFETTSECLSLPENSFIKMPITTEETLIQVAEKADSVEPTAFIYHISRCGSTLLTQMLSLDERFITLSEVPLFDMLLRFPLQTPAVSEERSNRLFKAVMKILGRKRTGKEQLLVVKPDSWHTMMHGRIRSCYPNSIAFLLSRAHAEVIRSQLKRPAMHAVPGLIEPALLGFSASEIQGMLPADYLPLVLERYSTEYERILERDPKAYRLEYEWGATKMLEVVLEKLGVELPPEIWERAQERAKFHSKQPAEVFVSS